MISLHTRAGGLNASSRVIGLRMAPRTYASSQI